MYTVELEFEIHLVDKIFHNAFDAMFKRDNFPMPVTVVSIVNKIQNLNDIFTEEQAEEISKAFIKAYLNKEVNGKIVKNVKYLGIKKAYKQTEEIKR